MRVQVIAIAVSIVALGATPAAAEREFCGPDVRHRGKAIDLDFQRAEIHDVFRLLAETGNTNVVISDDVRGKVTIKLKRVAWDRALCAIAAVHKLLVTVDENVLLVRQRAGG
jgi:type II secretory pathway component HofQ